MAVVDKNVERKGTRALAEAYLNYLYSEGQRIAAKNFYRPRNEAVAAEFKDQFPALKLVTIDGTLVAGRPHNRSSSMMAAFSTRSIRRSRPWLRRVDQASPVHRCLP